MGIKIAESDLLKILDVLESNLAFHQARDQMNSHLHLAKTVRYSPLTSETQAAAERVKFTLVKEK